jgi:hypothetical protein
MLESPQPGDRISLREQRVRLRKEMMHDLIKCNAQEWLATYALNLEEPEWNGNIIEQVTDHLYKKKILTDQGWASLSSSKLQRCKESKTLKFLDTVATEIAIAVHAYTGKEPTWVALSSPTTPLRTDVAGFQPYPDWRTIMRFNENRLALPDATQKSTRSAAQNRQDQPSYFEAQDSENAYQHGMIGELQEMNKWANRQDVRIVYHIKLTQY